MACVNRRNCALGAFIGAQALVSPRETEGVMDDRTARHSLKRDTRVSSRRPWIILLVLVLLGLAIWGAVALVRGAKGGGAGAGGGSGRRGGRPPTTVGMAAATLADIPVTLDALGTV